MKKLSLTELKGRVSWGSVFGGVMTVLAISVLLSILNSSIGLFMFEPLSDHPAAGIGTAVGIFYSFWTRKQILQIGSSCWNSRNPSYLLLPTII